MDNVRERVDRLTSREKLILFLVSLFVGGKIVEGAGKVLLFVIWVAVIFGFIGFCLLMAWLTGA